MLSKFLQDKFGKNQMIKSLYRLIHKEGPVSKMDLINKFHLPQTTLSRMINELVKMKMIRTNGYGHSKGGRPPALYEIEPTAGYLIGIEIARTHVKILVCDLMFHVLNQIDIGLTHFHTPQKTVEQIIESIKEILQENNTISERILGIGIGAVGPLDRDKGVILDPEAFQAEGWKDVPIVSMIKEAFPVPVVLNNGANTAALAEYHFRKLSDNNILYCINGYGIRCGFINKGDLLNMNVGDTSSFGHIIIETNGRPCTCGKKGCLTSYASFGAIFERINELQKNKTGYTNEDSVERLMQAIRNNDAVTNAAVMESAFYYGIGIANMINVLHPNIVVLHGKLIYHYEDYYDKVVKTVEKYVYSKNKHLLQIQKGTLGEKAIAIGAALLVFYFLFD